MMQAGFVVVDKHRGGDVHGVHQHDAFLHAGFGDEPLDFVVDRNNCPPSRCLDPDFFCKCIQISFVSVFMASIVSKRRLIGNIKVQKRGTEVTRLRLCCVFRMPQGLSRHFSASALSSYGVTSCSGLLFVGYLFSAKKVRLWLEGGMEAVSFTGLLTTGGRRSNCFIADIGGGCQPIILEKCEISKTGPVCYPVHKHYIRS
jgi:hypothetical protein